MLHNILTKMKRKTALAILATAITAVLSPVKAARPLEAARDTLTDDSMVIIESVENEADSILANWFLQEYTDMDSLCISRSHNIEYPDSVYIERLAALPTVIDMPYNQVVKKYITLYTEKRRKLVESLLGFGIYYFPIFEQALEEEEIPLELKYLPIIESALRPNAVSRAGATGLWQFMLATSRSLGLEVNSLIDERRSPIASSRAAAKYLKQLYGMYGDWHLAIAAYNCGPGNINKAIHRSGGKKDYWSIYHLLPRETRGYVPAFIAANYIMNYYDKHNICPVRQTTIPLVTDTIEMTERVNLQQISAVLGTPIDMLRELNPQYRHDIVPGDIKPCHIIMPLNLTYAFIDSKDTILNYRAEQFARLKTVQPSTYESSAGGYKYHKIRPGETLGGIALRYHTTVTALKRMNGLRGNTIRAGKYLKVGIVYDTASKDDGRTITKTGADGKTGKYYKVASGDTLGGIALRYGIKTENLKRANNLRSSLIRVGQVLKIPVT